MFTEHSSVPGTALILTVGIEKQMRLRPYLQGFHLVGRCREVPMCVAEAIVAKAPRRAAGSIPHGIRGTKDLRKE